jgi:hypothetical protein
LVVDVAELNTNEIESALEIVPTARINIAWSAPDIK